MSIRCEFCGDNEFDVLLEYSFDMSDGIVENREVGTINAVCKSCNREQYLAKDELPSSIVSSLLK